MSLWPLLLLGGVGLVVASESKSGPVRSAPRPSGPGAPPGGSQGFPDFSNMFGPASGGLNENSSSSDNLPGAGSEMFGGGDGGGTDPSTGQSSTAAATGLSDSEANNLFNTPNNSSGIDASTNTSSEAASIGLSDDEYNTMMNSVETSAASLGQPASGLPAPTYDTSSATASNDAADTDTSDAADGSVDMGATTSTDVDPGFPGAEGTSATASGYRVGFHVAGPGNAPPNWTDNNDGSATDPTNSYTLPYAQAWDYYDAFLNPNSSMSNSSSGVSLPTSGTVGARGARKGHRGKVGEDLDSHQMRPPPGWFDNRDGTATDPTGQYTLDFSDAWDYYSAFLSTPVAPMQNVDSGASVPAAVTTSGRVGDAGDLSFSPLDAPPGWLDNGDGTVTDPSTGETLSNDDAWNLVESGGGNDGWTGGLDSYGQDEDLDPNAWNSAWDDGDGYPDPSTYNLPYYPPNSPSPLNHNMGQFQSFGEYHGPTGAPIVRDSANRPYAVSSQGTMHAVTGH